MNPRFHLLAFALLAAGLLAAAAAQSGTPPVGLRILSVPTPARGGAIEASLWYPAAGSGKEALIGDSKIFQGVAVLRDSPVMTGPLPVILLSHGGMRAAPNMGNWIAARLAANGYLVAMAGLPDPRSLRAQDAPREIGLRPADLSATLTAVEKHAAFAGRIDASRIGVLGFFLGGTAALSLAGGELDAQSYASSCDDGRAGPDCAWYAKAGADLHHVDAAALAASHRDERIGIAVLVAPELGGSFAAASLARLSIPVEIIHLGAAAPAVNGARLAQAIPGAHHHDLANATAFSAFAECKPKGAAILRSEGEEETLCQDGGTSSRAEIHARLAAMIDAAFRSRSQSGL